MTTQTNENRTITKANLYVDANQLGFFENLQNREQMERSIYFKVVNQAACRYPLDRMPHQKLLGGLVKVFCIYLATESDSIASVLIDSPLMEHLHLTLTQLISLSDENTPMIFKSRIFPMGTLLGELMGLSDELPSLEEVDENMLVLTNTAKINGASYLFYPSVLEQFTSITKQSYFILPSSVHEAILLKDSGDIDALSLKEMVNTINETEVPEEEILSDHVFYYSAVTHTLSVVA